MNTFKTFLKEISRRPGMYVGECSIRLVSHCLEGYDHAMVDNAICGQEDRPLFGWIRWVQLRFLIPSAAWTWTRFLLHVYGSDRAALDALPALYDEFLQQRALIGPHGIEAELKRRFMAEYGEDWHVPEVTTTPDP